MKIIKKGLKILVSVVRLRPRAPFYQTVDAHLWGGLLASAVGQADLTSSIHTSLLDKH